MKRNLTVGCALLMLLAFGRTQQAMAQCTMPSSLSVTSSNFIVNMYYPGTTANVGVGAVSISVEASQGANTGITKGDLLLISKCKALPSTQTTVWIMATALPVALVYKS